MTLGYLLLLQSDVVLHICLLFCNLLLVLHQVLWHLAKLRLESPPENVIPDCLTENLVLLTYPGYSSNHCTFVDVGLWASSATDANVHCPRR